MASTNFKGRSKEAEFDISLPFCQYCLCVIVDNDLHNEACHSKKAEKDLRERIARIVYGLFYYRTDAKYETDFDGTFSYTKNHCYKAADKILEEIKNK